MTIRKIKEKEKAKQKQATLAFIKEVSSHVTLKPKDIERCLEIYMGAWSEYKNGPRSWPFKKLNKLIQLALKNKLLTDEKAKELASICIYDGRTQPEVGEKYIIDCSIFFLTDIQQTVEQLTTQIQQVEGRIKYGNEDLENAHYLQTSLQALEPIQALINKLSERYQAEKNRLMNIYRIENYNEIDPQPLRPKSLWDVGYEPYWWTRPPLTQDEIAELRKKIGIKEN